MSDENERLARVALVLGIVLAGLQIASTVLDLVLKLIS